MRNSRVLLLLALIGLLSSLLAAPVGAQPSSEELRGDLRSAEERLQELQMSASAVVEDYNDATVALERASAELAATERELEALSGEIETLLEAAGDHARLLHKLGPTLELSSVFVGGEGAEIGARGAALRRIMDIQRADFEGLEAASTRMDALESRAAEQHAAASAHEAEVAQQRAQLESSLEAFDAEIAELQEEIAAAESREERERREAEEAEARREAAEQAAREAEAREAEQQAAREAEQAAQQETTSSSDDRTSSGSSGSGSGGTSGGGSSSSEPPPSSRQSASVAVDKALEQVGKPYKWGGSGPDSFDCSGLTSYAWRHAGVEITRTSRTQWDYTKRVSRSELQAGDLVFYSRDGTRDGIGHVAMYTGRGNEVVEAPYSGNNVRVRSDGLSRSDILGYGRV